MSMRTLAFALAIAMGASCAVAGFDRVDTGSGPGSGGAGGGNSQAGNAGSAACQHATWPPAPANPDPGPDDVDLVAAVRRIDVGEENLDRGPLVGYDLDQFCTCLGDGDSCKEPRYAMADHCDGPGGRDNAVASLFKFAGTFSDNFASASLTSEAEIGSWTMLVRVTQYNGKANDSQVRLALYPSPGIDKDPCWPVDTPPRWDGNDPWPVDTVSLQTAGAGGGGTGGAGCTSLPGYDIDQPLFFDDEAYVSDFHIVANLPNAGLVLTTDESAVTIKLVAGSVSARLEQANGRWSLREGLITGRWPLADFFKTVGSMTSGGDPICTDHPVYSLIKNGVCRFPDIASSLGGPTTPCDSMSFGMAFDAEPAALGIIVDASSAGLQPCPPETDPATDSCDTL
jgi:hypothetical protein